jgi:glycine/D-amino acid oxidase-like deaminating enzyme/nitrite reductase/ring-hydroxylating ferredoxin subunit
MKHPGGESLSLWEGSCELPEFSPIRADESADVCIIGGGISGLSTAYELVRAGRSVIVIDDGPIGGGETGRTTAHISTSIDDRYMEIAKIHGQEAARLCADSLVKAINYIEETVARENIDCDFERLTGHLFLDPSQKEKLLDDELKAATDAGLVGVEKLPDLKLPGGSAGPCLRFPEQAQFHSLKYLAGLARAITAHGGRIFTGTHAESVEEGTPMRVLCSGGRTLLAPKVVVATNTPVTDRVKLHTKQNAYRSYVIAAKIPNGSVIKGLYWDTADPYHYVRVHNIDGQDYLIVGGEDHRTGQADDMVDRYSKLELWASQWFPNIEEVSYRWSGQIIETVDGLGFIGKDPSFKENVYVATGDSGMGITNGTIAAILLRDLILGNPNPWSEIYDPSRKKFGSVTDFAKENINTAAQYSRHAMPAEAEKPADIEPGEGAIIRRGTELIAAYKAPDGSVYECSAVCPHLKGIVRWNPGEKTWDCPAHGSRFDPYGRVCNGPANDDLKKVEKNKERETA